MPQKSLVHVTYPTISEYSQTITNGKKELLCVINYARRGVPYPLFEIIMKFLTVKECQTKFARVCRSWKHMDFKMFCSYSSFKHLENSRFTAKELKVVLKKGSKTLPHMRVYKEIIRHDFRNQFEFLNQNVTMQIKVADNLIF